MKFIGKKEKNAETPKAVQADRNNDEMFIGLTSSDAYPPEKQEQAVAVAIDKLSNFSGESIKGFSEINNQESFVLVKMRALSDVVKNNSKHNKGIASYNIVGDEYLKHAISRSRKGRAEVVDIAKSAHDDQGMPKVSFLKRMMGGF